VVELGAGTGIVGLTVAAALGEDAEVVALTDAGAPLGGGRTTVDVLTETIHANGHAARRVLAARLIWGDGNGAAALRSTHGGGPFDVALGSELLYANNCAALALAASIEALGVQLVVLGQQTRPTGEAGLEDVFSTRMISAGFAASRTSLGGTAVMHTFERRLPT
jgi:hypothetical protein